MDNKHTQPATKEAALRSLGFVSKQARRRVKRRVEFAQVATGRELMAFDTYAPSVLVGVGGSVTMFSRDGHEVTVEAPFVIDGWAADTRRVAQVEVVARGPVTLLLIDWTHRDAVYGDAPVLGRLAEISMQDTLRVTEIAGLAEVVVLHTAGIDRLLRDIEAEVHVAHLQLAR